MVEVRFLKYEKLLPTAISVPEHLSLTAILNILLSGNDLKLPWREMVKKAFEGFSVDDNTHVRISPFGYFQKVDELLRNETTDKDRIMNNYIGVADGY